MRSVRACYTARVEPRADALVDARNVARSRWPNIPEAELVSLVQRWAQARGLRAVLVFDGEAPWVGVGERTLDEATLLVGTGRASADDRLVEESGRRRAAGEPFWLVTSDRALRTVAGEGAERTIGGGAFARELLGERG